MILYSQVNLRDAFDVADRVVWGTTFLTGENEQGDSWRMWREPGDDWVQIERTDKAGKVTRGEVPAGNIRGAMVKELSQVAPPPTAPVAAVAPPAAAVVPVAVRVDAPVPSSADPNYRHPKAKAKR